MEAALTWSQGLSVESAILTMPGVSVMVSGHASVICSMLAKTVLTNGVFANRENMRITGPEAQRETRLEKLVWQIEKPSPWGQL